MYSGRITQGMIFDKIKSDLSRNLYKVETARNPLTTGKRLNRPSDDPASLVKILRRKIDVNQTDRYIKNTENARQLLNQSSGVLVEVTDLLNRAREIALTFANDPMNSQLTNSGAKKDVENILSKVISLANTKEDGRYIFSGTETLTRPFETSDRILDMFKGNMGEVERQISQNGTMSVNVPGVNIFSNGVFQALIRLSEAVDTEEPKSEIIANVPFTTSEIFANFTSENEVLDENTDINDLDQLTAGLSDGDTVTISGKDSEGYDVDANFVYGTGNDGTTLGELMNKVEEAYSVYGDNTIFLDDNGNMILDFPESPMPAPELTIQFNSEDAIIFSEPPEFNIAEINQLDQVTADLTDEDKITISGTDSLGNNVEEVFTYGETSDGVTIEDLLNKIDSAFANSTVSLNDNGYVRLSPEGNTIETPSLSLEFKDEDGNGGAIILPNFTTKMKDSITKIDEAFDKVLEYQSYISSRINRLDETKDMLEDVKLNITELLSKEEDADVAEAITEFTTRQTAYRAALNASSQIMQLSLIDYLN